MLLNLRSLAEVEDGTFVGAGAATGQPGTSSATGTVLPPAVPSPTFTYGSGSRLRPEPLVFTGYGVAVGAMATSRAFGTVRPSPLLGDVEALALLGLDLLEIAEILQVDRLPAEAEAVALLLAPTRLRR